MGPSATRVQRQQQSPDTLDCGIQLGMRNAILELLTLVVAIVLWTILVAPALSAHGMNWLSILVYVFVTTETTRLCVTGRSLIARSEIPEIPIRHSQRDASRGTAEEKALRKVS